MPQLSFSTDRVELGSNLVCRANCTQGFLPPKLRLDHRRQRKYPSPGFAKRPQQAKILELAKARGVCNSQTARAEHAPQMTSAKTSAGENEFLMTNSSIKKLVITSWPAVQALLFGLLVALLLLVSDQVSMRLGLRESQRIVDDILGGALSRKHPAN